MRTTRDDHIDQNGNDVGSDRINNFNIGNNNRSNQNIINNNNLCTNDQNDNAGKGKVKKTISRLQAIGMTDDDDEFGKIQDIINGSLIIDMSVAEQSFLNRMSWFALVAMDYLDVIFVGMIPMAWFTDSICLFDVI